MTRKAQAWMFGMAWVAALALAGDGWEREASAVQPTFGPKKPREKPVEPEGATRPDAGAPKPPTPPRPVNPGVTPPPEEWNQDDGERKEPSGDAKPGEWFCWKTADGLRYAWSLPAKYEKSTGYCVAGPCAGRSLESVPVHVVEGFVLLDDSVDADLLCARFADLPAL